MRGSFLIFQDISGLTVEGPAYRYVLYRHLIYKKSKSSNNMDDLSYVAAVDLGATHLRTGIVDEDGKILAFSQNEVNDLTNGMDIQLLICTMIDELSRTSRVSPQAVGISTAGPVDLKTGSVVGSPNMKCERIFLSGPLQERFNVPVRMMTDCKAGVLGEYYFGGAKDAATLVYLTFSTGIGAGVLDRGKLLCGSNGNASEAGHFLVDTTWDLPCGCGGIGHWEAYASGTGIPNFFRAWSLDRIECDPKPMMNAGQILYAAEQGNPLFISFCGELAKINGRGLSSVIAAYNPDLIVLDGPIVRNYPALIAKKMTEYMDRYLPAPEIRISALEGKAPLLGASVAAFKALAPVKI